MFGIGASPKKDSCLIFDIGSGSIGAGLVDMTGSAPNVVWCNRQSFPPQVPEHLEFNRFMQGMLSTLQTLCESVQKEGLSKVPGRSLGKIYLIFASPWYISQTTVLKFQHEKSVSVEPYFSEIKKMLEQKEAALAGATPGGSKALVIEKQIIEARLNGYPTAHPHGKAAHSFEAAVLTSMLGMELYQQTAAIVHKTFGRNPSSLHSFALVSFATIRDIFAPEENFLLVDIGSEVTDIGVVRDDVLVDTISFPSGKNFILRAVAAALGITPQEAQSRIELYRSGKSEAGESKKVVAALLAVEKEWQGAFEKAAGELTKTTTLPTALFLTADQDLGEWFRVALLEGNAKNLSETGQALSVVLLTPEHFAKYITFAPTVLPDPFIALEALFAQRIDQTLIVD